MRTFTPDDDPSRWRANRRLVDRYGTAGDTHWPVAARIAAEGLAPVLDVGCGDGALAEHGVAGWIGIDDSPAQLAAAPRPAVRADAAALPVRTASCGAVAALWMLDHLDDPTAAVAEARRVLRPGGLFAACTTARDDSPELLAHLPPQPVTPFDAEEAPAIVGAVFDDVEIDTWDDPHVHLPSRGAAIEYLIGRGLGDDVAEEVATNIDVPLHVTRRGALVWARR